MFNGGRTYQHYYVQYRTIRINYSDIILKAVLAVITAAMAAMTAVIVWMPVTTTLNAAMTAVVSRVPSVVLKAKAVLVLLVVALVGVERLRWRRWWLR